jgi:hypothetical protein
MYFNVYTTLKFLSLNVKKERVTIRKVIMLCADKFDQAVF